MNPNKALWEKGDFTRIAQTMRESGVTLVKGVNLNALYGDGALYRDRVRGDPSLIAPAFA